MLVALAIGGVLAALVVVMVYSALLLGKKSDDILMDPEYFLSEDIHN